MLSLNATLQSGRQSIRENSEPQYDAILRDARALLQDGPVKAPHVLRLWDAVNWSKQSSQRVPADAEVSRSGPGRINLYPSLLEKSNRYAVYIVIKEFGHLLYSRAPQALARRWTHKLCLPSEGQITAVQSKLNPEYKSYREMVDSFATAMDRFVALNIANALIAKGVPYPQSQNIQLKQWGATQEYCNRRRYHILISLASAYSSAEIFTSFGAALADWVCGTRGISESSVAEAVHGIIRDILEGLR